MTSNSSETCNIPQADIFWDTNKWYWVDTTRLVCQNPGQVRMHDAIVDAIKNGYEIRTVRNTRGSVFVER